MKLRPINASEKALITKILQRRIRAVKTSATSASVYQRQSRPLRELLSSLENKQSTALVGYATDSKQVFTTATLQVGDQIYTGAAKRCTYQKRGADAFNPEIGCQIALSRALETMDIED